MKSLAENMASLADEINSNNKEVVPTNTDAQKQEVVEPPKTEEATNNFEKKSIDTGIMNFDFEVEKSKENKPITTNEEFIESINKNYGYNIKTLEDAFPIFDKAKQTEAVEKELFETKTKKELLSDVFYKIPTELLNAIDYHLEGKDYRDALKKEVELDFTKQLTEDELIKKYNDINDEELEDLEDSVKTKLYKASLKLYEKDKQEYTKGTEDKKGKAEKIISSQKEAAKKYLEKIEESVSSLKLNTNIKPEYIKNVEKKMQEGLGGLFVDDKGNYTKEASEKIFYAMYGKDIINSLKSELQEAYKRDSAKVASSEREKLISQYGNDTRPKQTQSGNAVNFEEDVKTKLPQFFKPKQL